MEEQQLTPAQAFEIIYNATGALQLNRADTKILDTALRTLVQLLPQEQPVGEVEGDKKAKK